MNNKISYKEIYKDNRDHARHHESQRSTMSYLIIIITAAVSGIVSIDKNLSANDISLTLLISILGILGLIFSIKFGHRIGYHLKVSRKILKYSSPEVFKDMHRFQKDSEAESNYPKWIINKKNTFFWIILHSFIIFYGIILTFICIC